MKRWVHEWLASWANPNCPNIEWLSTSATFGVQLFPNTLHPFHLHSAICDGVDAYPYRWKITPNDMRTSTWSPLKIQPLTFTICDWQGPWRCTRAHLQDPYLPAQFMSILYSDWYDLDPKDVRTDYHHLTPPKFISRTRDIRPQRRTEFVFKISYLFSSTTAQWMEYEPLTIIWPTFRR